MCVFFANPKAGTFAERLYILENVTGCSKKSSMSADNGEEFQARHGTTTKNVFLAVEDIQQCFESGFESEGAYQESHSVRAPCDQGSSSSSSQTFHILSRCPCAKPNLNLTTVLQSVAQITASCLSHHTLPWLAACYWMYCWRMSHKQWLHGQDQQTSQLLAFGDSGHQELRMAQRFLWEFYGLLLVKQSRLWRS